MMGLKLPFKKNIWTKIYISWVHGLKWTKIQYIDKMNILKIKGQKWIKKENK